MPNRCTVIMYHYVRELQYTRYPGIKGRTVTEFRGQLEYLAKNYTFVRAADIVTAAQGEGELPPNAVWLTFDDAYVDHYANVFPILDAMGIEGAFFPPVKAIVNHEVLDVNKIHFVLASVKDLTALIKEINHQLDVNREEYSLKSNDYYRRKFAHENRFDPAEVIFVKRLLQVELPEKLRHKITSALFAQYVSDNEAAFSRELYMNKDQMRCMHRHGMTIGSHGYDHYWLDSLPPDKQAQEVDRSLDFLREVGTDMSAWVMCYPYGARNKSLLALLRERGCKLGLTTEVRVADLTTDNVLELPRLDTNDLTIKA